MQRKFGCNIGTVLLFLGRNKRTVPCSTGDDYEGRSLDKLGMTSRMIKESRNKRICLTLLYAIALGIAVSVTMTLSYQGIRGGADVNHLRLGGTVILRGLGFAVPAFGIVWLLQTWVNRCGVCAETETGGRKLSDRRFFLLIWALLCLSWLPYLLTFYPGGVVGDGAETLEYVVDPSRLNNRWVVAQILILRLFAAVGRIFTPDINVGIFLYAMCSGAVYALACAAAVTELRRRGLPRVLVVLCTVLYAFAGHYASYGMGLWKDGLFGAGIVSLSLLLWKEPEANAKRKGWAVKTSLVLLFLCFWRNFIAWALIPAGMILLICRKQGRRLLAVLCIVIAVFSILVQGPVFGALGISDSPTAETLAVPMQQVAAVIQEGTELSEEQAEILFRLMPREKWIETYTPALADGVKFSLDNDYLQGHVWDFLKVWLQLGIRHPGTYLKAHLMETLGFWQPYGSNQGFYHDWFVGVQDIYHRGYTQKDLVLEATGTTLSPGLMGRLAYVPSGTAVWIMLLSLVLVLCGPGGKKKRMTVLLPYLLCWLAVTVTAPIAYCYRYVEMVAMGLPVFAALPFLREEPGEAGEPGKIRQALASRKAACAAALAAAAAMAVVLLCGSFSPYAFTDGKIVIHTCGAEDNHGYYVQSGLSDNEGSFTWTLGDELVVDFPYYGKTEEVEAAVKVSGTLNGAQRYRVVDRNGKELRSGELNGAGEIVFGLEAEDRIAFTVELPDAIVIPGETRKLAMMTTGIEIREK